MMYSIKVTSKFKKDYKRLKKRGYNLQLLHDLIELLAAGKQLDAQHNDHQLQGKMKDFRECHITSDWLLIYRIDNNIMVLCLMETGTHADLF